MTVPKPHLVSALAAAFACVFCAGRAFCAGQPGTTSVYMLKNDIGGRAIAMGGAMTALSDDIFGMRYNPAGIAVLDIPQFSAMTSGGVMDTGMNLAGAVLPITAFGIERPGEAGISVISSSNGGMDWYSTDIAGNAAVKGTPISAGGDTVVSLGYSERLKPSDLSFSIGKRKFRSVAERYMGAAVKLVHSRLPDTMGGSVSGNAYALDAGWLAHLTDWNMSVGFSLLNLGTNMTYISEANPLPSTLRAGAAYTYERSSEARMSGFTASLDISHYIKEQQAHLLAGLEVPFEKVVIFRVGYRFFDDTGGITFGGGIRHKRISCDIGLAFNELLGNAYQLSATYRLGDVAEAKPVRTEQKAKRGVMITLDKDEEFIEAGPNRKPEKPEKPKTFSESVQREHDRMERRVRERISAEGIDRRRKPDNVTPATEASEDFVENLSGTPQPASSPAKSKPPAKRPKPDSEDDLMVIH
ncbi:MAG: PorV/PorQ family protein [Elusimicrobiales bacterium]